MDPLPPTSPSLRPRTEHQPNPNLSPLNPTSSPHAIAITGRLSGTSYNYGRKLVHNSPNTPTRFLSSRTPLSFLSNSPNSPSDVSQLSSRTSIGWQLRTPTTIADSASDPPSPSPAFLPAAQLPVVKQPGPYPNLPSKRHNVQIARSIRAPGDDNGSPSFGLRNGRPSPLDNKLAYLQSIPPSPPIMIPSAHMLGSVLTPDADPSLVSPFALLDLTSSSPSTRTHPASAILSVTSDLRRSSTDRRGSSLANEIGHIDLDDTDTDSSTDAALDGDALIPRPNSAITAAPCPSTPTTPA